MARRKNISGQIGFEKKREIPKMPEGYYSGDKPNPNLKKFVEEHIKENPYNPTADVYDVPTFNEAINSTKTTAIYNMHSYHQGKKPHDAIRQYIRHYTKPGDLILDPFCGSGGTALAALMEGRKAIAIDRSPAATFITKNYCTPVDTDELRATFEELEAKVKPEIDWLYRTRCDRCGGNAATDYTVYSQVFRCPRCMEKVPLFDCIEAESETAAGKPKKIRVCPHCYRRGINDVEISTRSDKFGSVPVLVGYICQGGCKPAYNERKHDDLDSEKRAYFRKCDIEKVREIEGKEIPYDYPRDRMMHAPEEQECWGAEWRPGRNFRTVDELFTKRNLYSLALLFHHLNSEHKNVKYDAIRFGLNALILAMSRMQGYCTDPRFPNQLMRGTYFVPPIGKEYNTSIWLEGKIKNLIAGYRRINDAITNIDLVISTQSAANVPQIVENCVDYIFTDPPYTDTVQYGELNFIWESWMKFDTHWHSEEVIINEVRGTTETDWAAMMKQAMEGCYRVLKPGRWLSLCYHDTSEGTWALVQDIMAEVGFIVGESDVALFIDTGQKSYNQRTADKVNKRDLVINFRKPRPGEVAQELIITGNEDEKTFHEKVKVIIIDHLSRYTGATMDRVYDDVVSKMVRRGEYERHNFKEILTHVAEESEGRWYLKETAEEVDAAEQTKEDKAAQRLETFMEKYLKENAHQSGVHYSDLFEQCLVIPKEDKPRRLLQEWMWDYFFKTTEGTWRPPLTDEEREQKAGVRQSGLLRRVKRFANALMEGTPIRQKDRPENDATLAEWVRECRRAGLYDHGRALYEKGGINADSLDEESRLELEEDYAVCVRHQLKESRK